MEKMKMQTTNVVDENIKKIGELFPNCLTERLDENGKPEVAIDFDQLRQELSKDIVEGPEERYQFTWPDKRNAIRLANAPTLWRRHPPLPLRRSHGQGRHERTHPLQTDVCPRRHGTGESRLHLLVHQR